MTADPTTPTTPRRRRPYAPRVPPERRREQLLDAALAVIVRDGYDGVSIDAIAREAGVTRPVVYGVYDGLGPLLHALLDRQRARVLDQLGGVLDVDLLAPDLSAVAAEATRKAIGIVTADPTAWRPILLPPHGTPAEVRDRIDADRERVRLQIEGLIGFASGGAVDAEVLSHALLAVLEHFGRLLIEDPNRFEPDRLVDSVVGVLGALSGAGDLRTGGRNADGNGDQAGSGSAAQD
jgi:AcrR family transcriptional regulator